MALAPKPTEISVVEIQQNEVQFCLIGTSALLFNRMAAKNRQLLLLGSRKKNGAEKQGSLKHNPLEEYRDSHERMPPGSATFLAMPATAFKGALMTAALDLPGTRRTEIGRLCSVVGTKVEIFGEPCLHMAMVRSADIAHTPDIRTRACIQE